MFYLYRKICMEYKEGDAVVIKGNDGKIKSGVIHAVLTETKMLMMPNFDWDGAAYIVDCNEKTSEGLGFCNTIPLENIIGLNKYKQ